MPTDKAGDYLLANSTAEMQRLRLQAQVWEPAATEFLATQLAAARSFVEEGMLANVSIIEGDAFNTGLPAGHFDLVHVRFLFAPVGRDAELLTEMLRLVRPGGSSPFRSRIPPARMWRRPAPRGAP